MSTAAAPASVLEHDRLRAAVAAAVDYYRGQLTAADGLHNYLHQRGLQALVNRSAPWQIGYAPAGGRHLTRQLRAAGFTDAELVGAGLCHRDRTDPTRLYDVFRDRLMFPVRDERGPVGFTGRAAPHAPPGVAKYVNTAQTALYDKGALLFGLAEQQDRLANGWQPALVEGPTDVLATWLSYTRSGNPGVVALAPCGTALTDAQAAIVCRLPGARRGIVAAFDGDRAGRSAIDKAWQLLRPRHPSRLLRAVDLPAGTDPAALLARPNGRAQVRSALRAQTRPLLEAVVDHRLDGWLTRWPRLLEDISGRCEAARALSALIGETDDAQEAIRIAGHIARRTRVHPETIAYLALGRAEAAVAEAHTPADRPDRSGPGPPGQAFPLLRLPAGHPGPRPGRASAAPSQPGPTTRHR